LPAFQGASSQTDTGLDFAHFNSKQGEPMATYKTLEDYCVSMSANTFKKIRAMISHDFATDVIDRNNYDELLEDLQTEIEEARESRRSASSA
jgi:hypothetical protein